VSNIGTKVAYLNIFLWLLNLNTVFVYIYTVNHKKVAVHLLS